MEETICSIEITKNNSSLKAKVHTETGMYEEYENDDLEYLIEMVYEDIQMAVQEDYW